MARRGRPRPGGGPPRKRRPNKARLRHRASVGAEPRVPDTPIAQLEEEARKDIALLMKHQLEGHGLLESERLLSRILEQHPEHADAAFDAAKWKVTGDPDSPFVHFALHRIVEQRVVTRDPGLDMSRLATGLPWHDAVHKGTEIVAAELFGTELEEASR